MKHYLFLILFICFSSQSLEEGIEKYEKFDSWLYSSIANVDLSSKKEIKNLGKILKLEISEYESGHSTNPLESFEFQTEGLFLSGVWEEPTDKAWISQIIITSNKWQLGEKIKVGDPVGVLKNVPISPDNDTSLKYCGINNCVIFDEAKGLIGRITITLYVD